MKYLLTLFFLAVIGNGILFAEEGTILILKSTYLYNSPDKSEDGRIMLTRKRQAHSVVDMAINRKKETMFQIIVPSREQVINGSGFIFENEKELKELGEKSVKVYSEIPGHGSDLTRFILVPSRQLLFTGQKEESMDFPNLVWRAVNYKITVKERLWVPDWAGFYRPDKEVDWLNRTYLEAIKMKLKGRLLDKILLGMVEIGFSKVHVRLALGNPDEEVISQEKDQIEWIYRDRKVIFKNNQVMQIL